MSTGPRRAHLPRPLVPPRPHVKKHRDTLTRARRSSATLGAEERADPGDLSAQPGGPMRPFARQHAGGGLDGVQRTYDGDWPTGGLACRIAAGHKAALWRHTTRFSSWPCRKPSEAAVGVMARKKEAQMRCTRPNCGGPGVQASRTRQPHSRIDCLPWPGPRVVRSRRRCRRRPGRARLRPAAAGGRGWGG